MKILFNLFFLTLISISFAQNKEVYIEIQENQITEQKNDIAPVYEIQMPVRHLKGNGIDYYNFVINGTSEKSFEELGFEILNPKFLTLEELQKKSNCEVHDLLSNNTSIYLVKKDSKNVYRKWICMYLGTVRNTVKMKIKF